MQRLEQRSPDAILLLFLIAQTVDITMPVFALLAPLEARILPDGDSGQNLSLLNVGSLVSLMICTVMTIVASRNRGWLLLPIVYAFALINLALATFMPNEYITHLEATPGKLSLPCTRCNWRGLITN